MKLKTLVGALAAIFGSSITIADSTIFALDSSLTGWTIGGTVTSQNTTYNLSINGNPYEISPAAGHYMAILNPTGASNTGVAGLASTTGLSSDFINTVLTGSTSGGSNNYLKPTNFAYMAKDFSLAAGTTYKFSWAYASQDYAPYGDGVFFSVANSGTGQFTVLARTSTNNDATTIVPGTTAGYPSGTVVLESYGSTQWYSKTFTVGAAGTYKIVFGDFNAADTAVQPILIVSDISGNIVGMIVGKGAISVLNSALAVGNTPALPAAAVIDANPGLQGLFSSAGLSTDQQISDAASQTLPLLLGGLTMATRSTMDDISRVIQARMEVNRGMSSGDGFLGDKKFWLKPFGSWADQNNKDATTGFQADTAGMIIGADGTLNDRTRIGLAFAYAKSNVNSASSVAPNGADINIYQLVGYGSYNLRDDMELNFQAGFGQNINSGERDILFAGSVAKSSYNSTTADLGVGLSRRYVLNEKTTFIPTIRVDYTQIHDNAYTESGAGALNLSVDARDTEQLLLGVEGKLTRQIKTNTMLTANLGLGYDVIHDLNRTTAYFAGAPGTAFAADGVQPARWTGRVGIGLVHTLASGMEISARYDYEGDYHFTNNTVSAKARWSF